MVRRKEKFWCYELQIRVPSFITTLLVLAVGVYHMYKDRADLFLLSFILAALVSWGTDWYLNKYPCTEHERKNVHG